MGYILKLIFYYFPKEAAGYFSLRLFYLFLTFIGTLFTGFVLGLPESLMVFGLLVVTSLSFVAFLGITLNALYVVGPTGETIAKPNSFIVKFALVCLGYTQLLFSLLLVLYAITLLLLGR